MSKQETLRGLMNADCEWERHADGGYTVTTYSRQKVVAATIVSESDLACIHPDLPQAIHCLTEHFLQSDNTYNPYSGHLVLHTLLYLQDELLILRCEQNVRHFVTDIFKLAISEDNPDQVVLIGYKAILRHTQVDNRLVTYSVNCDWCQLDFEDGMLEKDYPGWRVRWDTASSLGLEDYELAKAVFTHAQPQLIENVALPDGADMLGL